MKIKQTYKLYQLIIIFSTLHTNNETEMILDQTPPSPALDNYFDKLPDKNISIKLSQVDEFVKHTFICECAMCRHYEGKKLNEILAKKQEKLNMKVKQKVQCGKIPIDYYMDVVKKLIAPHHKIIKRGIDIFIPEICFFKDGQAKGMFLNKQLHDISVKKIHRNHINPNLIQKIFSERRRQYRQDVKNRLNVGSAHSHRFSLMAKKKPAKNKQINLDEKDAVIVRSTNGSQELMTETQFIMLCLKRKNDPVWKNIQLIRNNINVSNQLKNIVFVKFQAPSIKYNCLFKRAHQLMRIYGENILPGEDKYITNQEEAKFMSEILKKSTEIFAEYCAYKIVNFIQYFYDEKIHKLSCKILINQIGQPFLVDVTSLKKQALTKFTWTNQIFAKKQREEQQNKFLTKAIQVTQELQAKASQINQLMQDKYQKMKNKFGISMVQEENLQQRANNEFFRKIYPNFKLEISEVLKDKNLTLDSFKKHFLGFVPTKKPIMKPFNSHLVKSIHKLTPRLKVAQGHQIQQYPCGSGLSGRKSGYMSRQSSTSCSKGKSFSLNKTSSSFVRHKIDFQF